jgi:hypothetical protein
MTLHPLSEKYYVNKAPSTMLLEHFTKDLGISIAIMNVAIVQMSRFLFTTLPTNDFGLLTRSLPIACELKNRVHEIAFCHPARGPQILIADAGFENLQPEETLKNHEYQSFSR